MIERKNMHRYRYSDLGSGCLTWSQCVIRELANEHYMQANAEAWVIEEVSRLRYEPNGYWVPYEFGAHFVLIM